ncbi:MAG: anthranilate synthase component I family protein [Acidobacteria bacterium]|nr:anthranilate synthase component I family protein [Acidobacteriota bacterium]
MAEKTYRQVLEAVRDGANVVPLVREVPGDLHTAVSAFLDVAGPDEPAFLLESVEGGDRMARYSFLGARPFETWTVVAGRLLRKLPSGEEIRTDGGGCGSNPFAAIGDAMTRFRALDEPGLPRFCGGAVGYVGYEMMRHLEPSTGLCPRDCDEAMFMLFRDIIAFDRLKHRMLLIANLIADGRASSRKAYDSARDSLDAMEARLSHPRAVSAPIARPHRLRPRSVSSVSGDDIFLDGVLRLKRHIRQGDIFQAVLANGVRVQLRADPFDVYRALRMINPSPYMFFVRMDGATALGASPEMLVRVENGWLETRPIAGTRPRGATEAQDLRREEALLKSVKERAEHVMLVDLSRNDVGRVARAGSVRVGSFMQIERYSHVMHLVSSVRGRLKRGLSPWDAFAACFPAGTVTGAPKIRAMQLVSDIEASPRGLYGGAVVYHDFRGNLDSAIAIRCTEIRQDGCGQLATILAGAGIVADSQPMRELNETRHKARAVLEAVRIAHSVGRGPKSDFPGRKVGGGTHALGVSRGAS